MKERDRHVEKRYVKTSVVVEHGRSRRKKDMSMRTNFKEALGEVLGEENKKKKELAEDLGFSPMRLYSIEKASNPTLGVLIRIANRMGYDVILKPKSGTDIARRTKVLSIEEGSDEE